MAKDKSYIEHRAPVKSGRIVVANENVDQTERDLRAFGACEVIREKHADGFTRLTAYFAPETPNLAMIARFYFDGRMVDTTLPAERLLRPGTYALTQDVVNPESDKRMAADWHHAPGWKAGDRFVVADVGLPRGVVLTRSGERHAYLNNVSCTNGDLRANALAPYLSPVEPNVIDVNTARAMAGRVATLGKVDLVDLVEAGVLPLAVAVAYADAVEAKWNSEDETKLQAAEKALGEVKTLGEHLDGKVS